MSKKLINKPKKKFDPKQMTPEALLKLMELRSLTEIEFENEDFHFRASKKSGFESGGAPFAGSYSPQGMGTQALVSSPVADVTGSANPHLKKILSPFVGTFYRSSNPESEPFVKDGQRVNKGDTLCIIEAMKLMNEIEAEIQGRIFSVLIENGQPVEFGEPLFLIDPDL